MSKFKREKQKEQIEALKKLLKENDLETTLRQMSPAARELFERTIAIQKKNNPVPFDVVKELRRMRGYED